MNGSLQPAGSALTLLDAAVSFRNFAVLTSAH